MATLVKSLVKKTNKAIREDQPPTQMDVKLRVKHTDNSVDYNLEHIKDHAKNLVVNLGKLSKVDYSKAKVDRDQTLKVFKELSEAVKKVC